MKIVFLTPGTGSYYCGACMRDSTLARELHHAGHDVTIAPMYLPLMLDESTVPGLEKTPVFFGGINVYLQQKLSLFRKAPAVLDRLLNGPGLLRWAARHSHMTSAREHGEMTLQMLRVEASPFQKEWDKLANWLEQEKPALVCLSNALLAGFTTELKRRLRVPVLTFFQGEDSFLDGLPEPYRSDCWSELAARLSASDALVAPSRFYANFMQERLGLPPGAIDVVHNGIRLEGYQRGAGVPSVIAEAQARDAPATPTIGYLARMIQEKGLELLVDAFFILARDLGDTQTRLAIAGAATAGDARLIEILKRRIAGADLEARVSWSPNLTREQKVSFLHGLTLFSVPAVYAEAFGLYVIEAMACGIPVVQPAASAFPEIVGATGGGVCVPPGDARALAHAWQELLNDPARCVAMGTAARLGVEKHFSARTMGEQFLHVAERFSRAAGKTEKT
jgi:glycosyltransferase involved in cell wall biosynthesis